MALPKLRNQGFVMGLHNLHTADIIIIAGYLVCITIFGLRFRKPQRSLRDYFLADRGIPWWAISLSIVAAETSTLTIISTPGIVYDKNGNFRDRKSTRLNSSHVRISYA